MESYRPTTPFRQSTNHVQRPKTPAPERSRKQSCPEPPRRSRTPGPYDDDGGPWKQMVNTYEWVMFQEFLEIKRHERQARSRSPSITHRSFDADRIGRTDEARQRFSEDVVYDVDAQARIWMAQEEARRAAAVREAEKTRLIQEEVRRIQARVHHRREAERMKLLEERRRAHDEVHERDRRYRHAADKAVIAAWQAYESRWAAISTSTEQLNFRNIPWPLASPPSSPASINPSAISFFLLSPLHSETQSQKERIKEALRRWHPDRFRRFLPRVPEDEKKRVEEGVGIVARCLNDLLSRQGNTSLPSRIR